MSTNSKHGHSARWQKPDRRISTPSLQAAGNSAKALLLQVCPEASSLKFRFPQEIGTMHITSDGYVLKEKCPSSTQLPSLGGSLQAENGQGSDFIHFKRRFLSITIFRISINSSNSVSIFCDFLRFLCAKWPLSAPKSALSRPQSRPFPGAWVPDFPPSARKGANDGAPISPGRLSVGFGKQMRGEFCEVARVSTVHYK